MALLGSFNPIGLQSSDDLLKTITKTISPTIIQPAVQLAVNENFFGAPIYRENFPFGTPKPESDLAMNGTGKHWSDMAKAINSLTGGSDYRSGLIDISPDSIEHIFDFLTGSAGASIDRGITAVGNMVDGKETETKDTPFLRKLSGEQNAYTDINRFYKSATEIEQLRAEFKSLEKGERAEFSSEYKEKIQLYFLSKSIKKKLRNLNKRKRMVEDAKYSDNVKKLRIERLDEKKVRLVDDFNRRFDLVD
jgi:hypothetical protein